MKKVIAIFNLIGVVLFVFPTVTAQVSTMENVDPCITCELLMDLELPDVKITSAERIAEGASHCRILGVIGREIKFEILLPDKWNARFIMGGGGGFAGSIQGVARSRLNEGYAVSGTDTGHEGDIFEADWALNNMERQVNYAHLAVHRTSGVSKAIIKEYYGQFPRYNYFIGCSRGGNQALIEAQLYPEDFDGIVAGAPTAITSVFAKFIRNSQIIFPNPDNLDIVTISEAQFEFLQEAILEQCDEIDGIKDNIINDPHNCKLNYSGLPLCSDNIEVKTCFTMEQIDNIKILFAGLTIQGKKVYPEYPLGSDLDWWDLQYTLGTEWFKYIVLNNPEWNYSTYNFSDYFNDYELAYSIHNAASTNYNAFSNRGGRLIIYHGWNDGAISANESIEYFEAIKETDPSVDNYLKLYLLPGVSHCGGGPGPSDVDWVEIIRNWVENGNPSDRIIVSKIENDEVVMTRPIYPYPRIAVYDGSGDPNIDSSFIENK